MEENLKPAVLELKNISKSFDSVVALKDFSLTVREGEFITLLGASGCGKTTMLRIIAGLEFPDSGKVIIGGRDMENVGPEKRDVNMVFQNYALFPHMNVYQNIAYGLKIRKVPKEEIHERVLKMLALVRMEGFEKRMPPQMSGGQRQRVAIARALINNPRVLLLDEPLGALDLQLRRQMQIELKHLQKELGITFVYITHDQEEAINMSDRIVVMHDGRAEQIGSPSEVYDFPRTGYVARFVGSANVLSGKVESVSGESAVLSGTCGRMNISTRGYKMNIGDDISFAVRSENIDISREMGDGIYLEGVIAEKNFAGGMLRIVVTLCDGKEVIISRQGINIPFNTSEKVFITWNSSSAVPVDMDASEPARAEDEE